MRRSFGLKIIVVLITALALVITVGSTAAVIYPVGTIVDHGKEIHVAG